MIVGFVIFAGPLALSAVFAVVWAINPQLASGTTQCQAAPDYAYSTEIKRAA